MRLSSSSPPRLITAGYVTLDLIVRDLNSHDYWQSTGGTCGNVSAFASALGLDVTILARIGEDERGERLLQGLKTAGVETSHVELVSELRTPAVVEQVRGGSKGSHRFEFECPVCRTRLPRASVVSKAQAARVVDCISNFDAFFFDRATSATVSLAEAAKEAGLLVIFEPPTIPRTANAQNAAKLSNIVKVSQQPRNVMDDWIPTRGPSTECIVETLGSQGARFKVRSKRGWRTWREIPAIEQPRVHDAAGAGDWLTAGIITYLLREGVTPDSDTIEAALDYGQRLSAMSLGFYGPHGALVVLGAETIGRLTRGDRPVELPTELSGTKPKEHRTSMPGERCQLCLS